MRITKTAIAITIISLFALALTVSAYSVPLSGPTGNNTQEPIDVSATDQGKNGGLSVNTFTARGNAVLSQHAQFKGTIRGGYPSDSTSTLTISGDATVTGSLHAREYLNAQSISHRGDPNEKPLCSDTSGVIVFCD